MMIVSKLSEKIYEYGNEIGIIFYPTNKEPIKYYYNTLLSRKES